MVQVLTPIKKLSRRVRNDRLDEEAIGKDPVEKILNEHLNRIDKASSGIAKIARSYYETNKKINIIVVTVGIILLANSVAFAWIEGVNNWSLFSGGLGITSFMVVFFTKPQQNITTALGNLVKYR